MHDRGSHRAYGTRRPSIVAPAGSRLAPEGTAAGPIRRGTAVDDEGRPAVTPSSPSRTAPLPASSTARVVAVLDALVRAPAGGSGVRELAAELMLSRSATHRILATLADLGVARALDSGRYEITAVVSAWAYSVSEQHPVLTSARPIMARLAAACRENVHLLLVMPQRGLGVFVATAHGPNPVQRAVELGTPTSLTAGAAAKAVLAFLPPVAQAEVLQALAQTDPERATGLTAEIAGIQAAGHATSLEELIPDAAGVAAPFLRYGAVAGSLTISMPAYRRDAAGDAQRAEQVRTAAAALTAALEAASPRT
jgi:DNA-binding IclR family transcriptional regulator